MKHTENYSLKKPDNTDNYNIMHDNDNMDKIDTALKENEEALVSHVLDYASFKIDTVSQLADIGINATQFGAKFDNNTDDIIAINNAIQHVKQLGGGTVLLPRGYGKISAPIEHESSVILKGVGRDATFIVPTFTTGNVIHAVTNAKQKPQVTDLTIKPENYQYGLIGINYRYFQYGIVERVDVFNCGIAYDFDGTVGCYYNEVLNSRSIASAYGIRTKDGGAIPRANANVARDITIISPIIGVLHDSGNSNIFDNIRIESLENFNPTPIIDPSGATVSASDRWMLKISRGTASWFNKFRAEFDGNLVSLGATYGFFLKDFYCNYNGLTGEFTTLAESPANAWQTNNLEDVELGFSQPSLVHTYYNRRSRLGQLVQLPPQIMMTPRDTTGAPATGAKGYIRMDANGSMWVATALDTFKQIFYDATAAFNMRGPVRYVKGSTSVGALTVLAGGYQSVSVSMSGLVANDNCNVSVNVQIPDGLIVSPPFVNAATFNVTVRIYNVTASDINIPAATWTAAYSRP